MGKCSGSCKTKTVTPDAFVTTQVVDQIASQFPLRISYKLLRPEKPVIKGGIFGPNYG
jgi:hypothetical protein